MDEQLNPYEPPPATAGAKWWARVSRKELLLRRLPGICLFVALTVIRGIGRGIHDNRIPGTQSVSSKLVVAAVLLMIAAWLFARNRKADLGAAGADS